MPKAVHLYSSLECGGQKMKTQDCPGGTVVKNPPANAGDMGLSPSPGRSHMLGSK